MLEQGSARFFQDLAYPLKKGRMQNGLQYFQLERCRGLFPIRARAEGFPARTKTGLQKKEEA